MAISTYTELQTAVLSWMVRVDSPVVARVPDFIRLGETRLFRTLRLSGMVSLPASLTIVAGQNWVALPSDWLAFKRLRSAAEPRIEYMSPDALDDLPPEGDGSKYSIEGRRLIYGETPTADLVLTGKYYQRPAPLATVPSNWLLTENPDLYLYAALLEGWQWAQNSAKAGEYGTLLDKAIADAMGSDEGAMHSGSRLRQRPR